MSRSFLSELRGASLPEYGTLVSLVATLAVVSSIGFSHRNAQVFQESARELASLQDRLTLRCLTRTRAADFVSARQAGPYNCFHLGQGDDELTLSRGANVVYPGSGDDQVIALSSAGETEIVHSGGADTYEFHNANGVVDFGKLPRSSARLSVRAGDAGPVNLRVSLPSSSIEMPSHFTGMSVQRLKFSDVVLDVAQIAEAVIIDQQSSRSDHILGTPQSETISPGEGNDYVNAGAGDDVVSYTSGHDRYDAGPGRDVVQLSAHPSDLDFTVSPNAEDIILTVAGGGKIILLGQALYSEFSPQAKFALLRYEGGEMTASQIHQRALEDQVSAGDDTIFGTSYGDKIYPGKGHNAITPGPGNDIVYYQGGTDRILADGDRPGDKDILDLSRFSRDEVDFQHAGQGDLRIVFPDGKDLTVIGQLAGAPDASFANIDEFQFIGEVLPNSVMRQMFFPQQISAEP